MVHEIASRAAASAPVGPAEAGRAAAPAEAGSSRAAPAGPRSPAAARSPAAVDGATEARATTRARSACNAWIPRDAAAPARAGNVHAVRAPAALGAAFLAVTRSSGAPTWFAAAATTAESAPADTLAAGPADSAARAAALVRLTRARARGDLRQHAELAPAARAHAGERYETREKQAQRAEDPRRVTRGSVKAGSVVLHAVARVSSPSIEPCRSPCRARP